MFGRSLDLHTIAHTILRNTFHLFGLKNQTNSANIRGCLFVLCSYIKACDCWLLRAFKKQGVINKIQVVDKMRAIFKHPRNHWQLST